MSNIRPVWIRGCSCGASCQTQVFARTDDFRSVVLDAGGLRQAEYGRVTRSTRKLPSSCFSTSPGIHPAKLAGSKVAEQFADCSFLDRSSPSVGQPCANLLHDTWWGSFSDNSSLPSLSAAIGLSTAAGIKTIVRKSFKAPCLTVAQLTAVVLRSG